MQSVFLSGQHREYEILFAGIGSRRAPREALYTVRNLSHALAAKNYKVRTGGADGCDINFELAYLAAGGKVELWLPWPNFKHREGVGHFPGALHEEIARTIHPIYDKLPPYMRYLHARNVGQILGEACNTPVQFVACWTPDGCESEATRTRNTGGTGTAIALADRNNIPVFNLKNENALDRLSSFLDTNLCYPSYFNEFYYSELRPKFPKDIIFVFGSNLGGYHGAGAAKFAVDKHNAIYGCNFGIQGNAYAIPTKDKKLQILPLEKIKVYVDEFVRFTELSGYKCFVTPIGCGLAGYKPHEIAPLFKGVRNCWLPDTWAPYLM